MREIKFRGKRRDTGEWVFGSLINNLYKRAGTGEPVIHIVTTDNCDSCFNTCDSDEEYFTCEDCFVEVDPATVGQYIGEKDKNDREIYDGDIVRTWIDDVDSDGLELRTIVVQLDAFGCGIPEWAFQDRHYLPEIIGNIHDGYDNPELLEAES